MLRAKCQVTGVALLAMLAISPVARADEPPPRPTASAAGSAAPAPSGSSEPAGAAPLGMDGACDAATTGWATRASQRTGLDISAVECPSGLVRLKVAGAGCDFEVRRDRGFQQTADKAFGVSPIANLDWTTAPEPMKKALSGLLSALTEDPTLKMGTGTVHRSGGRVGIFGVWRTQIFIGAGVVLLAAAVVSRLRKRPASAVAAAPVAPPAAVAPPEPAAPSEPVAPSEPPGSDPPLPPAA
jgi:hypothetical protein